MPENPQNRKPTRFGVNQDSPQSRGLLMWYPFGHNTAKLAYDFARDHHGQIFSNSLLAARHFDPDRCVIDRVRGNYVLNFRADIFDANDDTEDWIEIGNLPKLGPKHVKTVSAWIKMRVQVAETGGYTNVIAGKSAQGSSAPTESGWSFFVNVGMETETEELAISVKNDSGTSISASHTPNDVLNDTNWHHVAATWDTETSSKLKLYLDGVEVAVSASSLSGTFDTCTAIARIGASESIELVGDDTPINYFWGWMDDIRFYNRVLSAGEMYDLYDPDTRWELYLPRETKPVLLASTSDKSVLADSMLFMPF